MKKTIPERSIRDQRSGRYIAEIYSDTWAELAGVTELDGLELESGSLAYTADGELCTLDSAGVWHKWDGSVISAEVSGDD